MTTQTFARSAALLLALTTAAFAAPVDAQLQSKAQAFTGYPCASQIMARTYAPQWPQSQSGFVAMSRLMGRNMEAAVQKAVKRTGRPMRLRWTQNPNTYIQYLYYAPYQGKAAQGTVIMAQFKQGKTYVSSCELKLK